MGNGDKGKGRKRSGILTPRDKEWLTGDNTGKNQKYLLREAMAQLMNDIEFLFQVDPQEVSDPRLAGLNDLFTRVDSDVGISDEECAKYLIALAFIIANQTVDYATIAEQINLHPRDEDKGEMPSDDDRPVRLSPMDFDHPINDLLTFRHALSEGIKMGKEHVERDDEEGREKIPDLVLIDSNTRLYKEPTYRRLNPKNRKTGFTSVDLRDVQAASLDAHLPELSREDAKKITMTEAVRDMQFVINSNVGVSLGRRREMSDEEIIRHDAISGHYADPPYRGTVSVTDLSSNSKLPLRLEIEPITELLDSKTIPVLMLTISNESDDKITVDGESGESIIERYSDPKGLVLLTEDELEGTDIKYSDCPLIESPSSARISDDPIAEIESGDERTIPLHVIGVLDALERSYPKNGEYRFTSTCSLNQNTSSNNGKSEELTWEFVLTIERKF